MNLYFTVRSSRRKLTVEDARKLVKSTPAVRKGKPKLLHNLQDKGEGYIINK